MQGFLFRLVSETVTAKTIIKAADCLIVPQLRGVIFCR
jgi:hypothetical protein